MDKLSLCKYLDEYHISFDEKQISNLLDLMDKTLATNESFNLTAIKDESSFLEKMIFDSAIAIIDTDLTNKKVIDVGTGAGFPGLVLYILNPECDMTLFDATKKKIDYLNAYAKEKQYQIKTVNGRAEEFALQNRDVYDYAFARAVSSLNILLEIIIPMIKVDGYLIALKGKDAEIEIKSAKRALNEMGCVIEKINHFILPESKEERNIIFIKKVKPTNPKYPRRYSQIKNKPL